MTTVENTNGNAQMSPYFFDNLKSKAQFTAREANNSNGCPKLFRTRIRFILMVLLLFCLSSVWSNILCFNFAILCIHPEKELQMQHKNASVLSSVTELSELNINNTPINQTDHEADNDEYKSMYTARERLYLTSTVAAAAIVSNFVVLLLVNQFGIRVIFTLCGLFSGISTCLLPLAINMGFYYVLGIRVIQGMTFAALFPAIGSFSSKWTYYKQNGLFVSTLVAYIQFSPAITMPVSGALCTSSWGWPSVFYVHGCASVVLFTIFAAFYRNSPSKHCLVTDVELRKIAVGKSELGKDLLRKIPYIEILKTASVWAVWIGALGNFFCVNMMFLFSPNYLHLVLKFPVRNTGFSASLPPLAQFSIKLLAGLSSDKVRCLSETNKLRLYNSIAFFGSAFFLTILAFFPTEYSTVCLLLLGCSAGILGCTTGGFFKAGPLVSKHYSHFVTGNVSLGITITMLIVPVMVTGVAPNHTASEWSVVFLCTATVLVLTNLLFIIMASAMPAPWTTDEFSRNASGNKVHVSTQEVFGKPPTSQAAVA